MQQGDNVVLDTGIWPYYMMIDEDTMVIMKDMECEWGYKAKSDVILRCKLTSSIADEDERMKQWNKLYTFSMGVKKDIDGCKRCR